MCSQQDRSSASRDDPRTSNAICRRSATQLGASGPVTSDSRPRLSDTIASRFKNSGNYAAFFAQSGMMMFRVAADVHFNAAGYAYLGKQVVESIEGALK